MAASFKYSLCVSLLLFPLQYARADYTFNPLLDDFYVEKYNTSCTIDADCDPSLQLKCTDGVCQCPQPEITVFLNNSETAKCYVKSRERCNSEETTKNSKPLECVPNSKCSTDGFCVCNNGTFETVEGVCNRKRDFFGPCQTSSECQEEKGLSCNELQFCECDAANFWIRGSAYGRCDMLAGHGPPAHISDFNCVINAHYNDSTGKCECNPGFNETKYGICVVPFGAVCDDFRLPCAPDMSCINGRCECHFGGNISANGTCYSKVGQPCKMRMDDMGSNYWTWKDTGFLNTNLTCTSNSFCAPNKENSNLFECQCFERYVNVDGECQLDHNEFCGRGKEVQKCDQTRGLQCIDSTCECPPGKLQQFDYELKYCRGLVGAPCVVGTEDELAKFCTAGAHCMASSKVGGRSGKDNLQHKGHCKCKPGYKLNDDRTCVKIENMNSSAGIF